MEALKIVAGSWPLALMFVAACGGGVMVYLIRRSYRYHEDLSVTRGETARDVTRHS